MRTTMDSNRADPVLVTGAAGYLGSRVAARLTEAGRRAFRAVRHPAIGDAGEVGLDLSRPADIGDVLDRVAPGTVVHAAAMSSVPACEADPAAARVVNVEATARIAAWCREHGARLVFVSTDQVFDGERGGYRESDPPAPINVYGRSKLDAEDAVRGSGATHSVVRSALVFGEGAKKTPTASGHVVDAIRSGAGAVLFEDEHRSFVHVDDVVAAIVYAATDARAPALLHAAGPERLSRVEFGRMVASAYGLDASSLRAGRRADAPGGRTRPADVTLNTELAQAEGLRFRAPGDALRDMARAGRGGAS